MNNAISEIAPIEKAIGEFLGIVRCLLFICNVDNFKKWMNEYHSLDAGTSYLTGYKLVFNTLFRMLASNIEDNISLGLSSDDIFDRASFQGKYIGKLPNTCEKTIVIKNLLNYSSDINDSNNWDTLTNNMVRFSNHVLFKLDEIRNVAITNPKFHVSDMATAIDYSSMFEVYIFLNDTSRGFPHGYTSAMLEDIEVAFDYRYKIARNLGSAFIGYKYGVQYLWSQLLKDEFRESVISHLHNTDEWDSFDKFFERIRSEIINPIEKSTGGNIGFDYLILIDKNPKRFLHRLLENKPSEIELSPKENMQRLFLWYPIQLIDSSEYSFSGIPALIPLLMGMIQIKRRANEKSKARVVRVIHGEATEHRRDYSYAVLVELSGYISDSSGWLLFYDCCSDRGSTSGLFYEIEKLLNRYSEDDFIDITSVRVSTQSESVRFLQNENVTSCLC